MKVCVFGVGAVGSYLVARLAGVPGIQLSAVARGDNLRALQADGVRMEAPDATVQGKPAVATDDPDSLPAQDIVFVTLKSTALPSVAAPLRRLVGKGGHAVFVTNGIPWWWRHGLPDAGPLPLLDPQGELWSVLTPQRALGCVAHSGNEIVVPGLVRHNGNNQWPVGEPDGTDSERLRRTVQLLQAAGVNASASADLRRDIFVKLLRNAAFNSICTLTGLPMEWLPLTPSVRDLTLTVMDEVVDIARAHGYDVREEANVYRHLKTPGPGLTPELGQKPSMLQDALAGRPMEIDAIIGQTCAFADEVGVPCPALRTLLPLLHGLQARGGLKL